MHYGFWVFIFGTQHSAFDRGSLTAHELHSQLASSRHPSSSSNRQLSELQMQSRNFQIFLHFNWQHQHGQRIKGQRVECEGCIGIALPFVENGLHLLSVVWLWLQLRLRLWSWPTPHSAELVQRPTDADDGPICLSNDATCYCCFSPWNQPIQFPRKCNRNRFSEPALTPLCPHPKPILNPNPNPNEFPHLPDAAF